MRFAPVAFKYLSVARATDFEKFIIILRSARR